ncbi:arginase family protein [Candidatus Pantoea bituminis]|uniref:arginase family protein n=1 Tax=Candidatus Pantoea bituminis TaxID=2831036 RepID=UPI001C063E51|nr:arginase family protein [Pantoea bituminis]
MKNLRMIFPMWQGGNLTAYKQGAELLAMLAPEAGKETTTVTVPVHIPRTDSSVESGITGRNNLKAELEAADSLIRENTPDSICVLGGDCLVDLAPFAWLSEQYQDGFGILWLDTHPDVMTPSQYPNAHAHVLGALMGNGDEMLTRHVNKPVPSSKIMIAGIHSPNAYEHEFLEKNKINQVSPEEMMKGTDQLKEWIEKEKITHLAIHFDLDILDPNKFTSLNFNNPYAKPSDFEGIAQGKLELEDVINWILEASSLTKTVGLGITEYLPWDAIRLKDALSKIPILTE